MRLSVVVVALLSAGCNHWKSAHPLVAGKPGEPVLEAIQSGILTPRCALGSCHGSPTLAARLDLSSVERSCSALVGARSCLFNDRTLVVAGAPEESYLYAKLVGEELGTQPDGPCARITNGHPPVRMPYGDAKLGDDQISQVRRWILDGAHCDAGPTDGGVDMTGDGGGDMAGDGGTAAEVATLTSPTHSIVAGKRAMFTVTLASPAGPAGQLISLEVDDATVLGAPTNTFVPAGQKSATVWVQGLRPGPPTRIRAHSHGATAEARLAVDGLRLAELFYRAGDSDDGKQWVKLINASAIPIDLSQYRLGAGSSSYLETSVLLAGVLPAGACFVVGGPVSTADNGSPAYAQILRFEPTIPRAGASKAAGVALFDVTTIEADTLPIDTVVYGAGSSTGLVRPDGSVATPDAAEVAGGHSLVRGSDGWRESASATPNTCIP